MKVAFVTPEYGPLVRRTNLAGVSESLSTALREAGADCRVFLPHSLEVSEAAEDLPRREVAKVRVRGDRGPVTFSIEEIVVGDVPIYVFREPRLFGIRHPYGDENGPYQDNWRRYSMFSKAVLESLAPLDFAADVFHCLDWTSGLLPVYQQLNYAEKRPDHPAARAGTWFGIHNLAMQGPFEREILPKIGIPHEYFKTVGGLELAGKVNFLKAGAEYATVLGTHSPTHALRIQERDRGYGMEEVFRRRKKELVGITNGIDYDIWNPASDPLLPASFSATDKELAGKRKCKQALQASLKLDNGPRTPVACSIGRWDADSGFDLLSEILNHVLERNVELIVMGQGPADITQRLKTLESSFIGRLRVVENYQPSTAHLIMGGSDMLLLPAHYQPSNPLFAIAMRYGVAPLVYAGGGLDGSVVDAVKDPKQGTGFHFEPYSADGLMEGVNAAIGLYRDAAAWKALQRRCLAQDYSWSATAAEYLKAYRRVTRRVRSKS